MCDEAIALDTIKALKDVIGREYENHRQRIFSAAGFKTATHLRPPGVSWRVDGLYYKNQRLVVLEETKGHYSDKCFTGRAYREFIETIVEYNDMKQPQPRYIFHVFGPPSSLQLELQFWDKIRPDLTAILRKQTSVTYICQRGRNPVSRWFTDKKRDGGWYTKNSDNNLIAADVQYINDLFHSS